MTYRLIVSLIVICGLSLPGVPEQVQGEEASTAPKLIPLTRPHMKQALETLKERDARLPLSRELLPDEESRARATVNNALMRSIYLPKEWQSTRSSGRPTSSTGSSGSDISRRSSYSDPQMTLDGTFKTELFWIVSRANNCHYCLGHQELKLAGDGLDDDTIAALDCHWDRFPEASQAAFAFTRKLTVTPHLVTVHDIHALKKHYSDPQIVELIQTVASNNSTNRWTDSMGLPQDRSFGERKRDLLTPTSEKYATQKTHVAPLLDPDRPPLEPRQAVESQLTACSMRQAHVRLPDSSLARTQLGEDAPAGTVPQWVVALAYFPQMEARAWKHMSAVEQHGRISPKLKAQIAWTAARQNRAWYSVGHAMRRLQKLGLSTDQIFQVDNVGQLPPAERVALEFARKLTAAPQTIADYDIARLKPHYSAHEIAEIVYVTCHANYFDRLTEALSLPLEAS